MQKWKNKSIECPKDNAKQIIQKVNQKDTYERQERKSRKIKAYDNIRSHLNKKFQKTKKILNEKKMTNIIFW
jgi:hypothetical protein